MGCRYRHDNHRDRRQEGGQPAAAAQHHLVAKRPAARVSHRVARRDLALTSTTQVDKPTGAAGRHKVASPTGARPIGTFGGMAGTGGPATDRDARPPIAYLIALALVSGGVLLGVWIALVGQADLQDNIAGLGVAAAGLFAGWLVSVGGRAVPQFRWGDLARIARFGPELITQTGGVYAATWRRVRGRGQPSGFRTVDTGVGGGGWRSARRSGVVAALLSFTPDTIVVDIDAETGVATVHDFVARSDEGSP